MDSIKIINGGICAPKGFKASGIHCGIRRNKSKKDLALIVSECRGTAAAVYTQNLVKGAPLTVTKNNIQDGYAQAVICNSGNANTCNPNGIDVAEEMCSLVASATGIGAGDVIVASTGVIGQPLDIQPIKNGIKELVSALGQNSSDAANAIMTTDTTEKEFAVSFMVNGKLCKIGGIAKGSGMIHPNMATMLVFLTSDVNISSALLHEALLEDVEDSFNMVSVDGDTSTNDMVSIITNGMAGNSEIVRDSNAYLVFKKALSLVTKHLCREIAKDGEGASKLLTCKVEGARNKVTARLAAKSVICSSLVKTAMFGSDANWGRVLCAIGYSGGDIDVSKIDLSFSSLEGEIEVCRNGAGIKFSEDLAKKILEQDNIDIIINLNDGQDEAVAWGCDLSYDYVKINGDYRT